MTPETLAALHGQCFGSPRPWSADEFNQILAGPGVFLCGDGEGFAIGRVVADEAELLTLAVAPETRRRGIGRNRLLSYETEARRRGAEMSFLEVAADNAAAIALYHSAGYKQVGQRTGYYRQPGGISCDALVFRRHLVRG